MKVSVKETAPCEKVLSVAVSGDLIREEYEHFFQEIGKEARVPGFRPGKAPREVLAVRFREEARERVLERLISRSFREAVGEKEIEFLGSPTIRQVEFTEETLTYEALVEIPPAVKLAKYKGLTAQRRAVEVKPEELEEALARVRESLAKLVAVEDRAAVLGDLLLADYACRIDGKEVESRTDDWFELREEEFLKGFSSQLVGVRAGEEREVRIRFPETFERKEWVGKEGVFRVRVKELKEKRLPSLDDEMAKETGEFQSLDELKRHLEREVEAKKAREVEIEFENALLEALFQANPFEVPQGVVERRSASLVERGIQTLSRAGLTPEAIEKQRESLREKFRPEAEKEVRLSFLLDEIAKREKLELKPEDFEAKYRELGGRHRQPIEVVRKFYDQHSEAKESLGIQILNEKVIQLIKEQANPGRVS